MNFLPRWMAQLTRSPLAVLTLQGLAMNAQAFTDTNAEMKEHAAAKPVPIVAKVPPAKPVQLVWVPPTAKSLDGFKPVLPPEPARLADAQRGTQTLAKADAATRAKR
jgi:hypothetical protein